MEKAMATHSSTLAWRIPWTQEPGGLLSVGSHRVGHDWSDLAAAAYLKLLLSPCCSVTKSYLILCDPMDCSMPYFPLFYHLLEFAQSHVHWVSDAIQLSHLLSAPSPPALNVSQHQCLLQWIGSSHQVGQSIVASASASVLPKNIQGWFPLGLTGLISLLSKELSRVFSSTTIQKRQFFSTQASLWSSSHICTWLLEKPQLWLYGYLSAKWFLICSLALLQLFFQGASIF